MNCENYPNKDFGYEIESPVIRALIEHLKVELQIFKSRNDAYGIGWALLPLIRTDEKNVADINLISRLLKNEADELIKSENLALTTELVTKFALGIKVLTLERKRVPQSIVKFMKTLLKESERRDWLKSPELVAMLLFTLSQISDFHSELSHASVWLYKKFSRFKRNNYLNMIDAAFGLLSSEEEHRIELPSEEILRVINIQSIEKISKFLFYLARRQDIEHLKETVAILERRANEKFRRWLLPEVELSLFECMSLINSNLPEENVKAILENLRKNDVEWAKSIDIDDDRIVITNTHRFNNVPNFNVKEDALCVLALLEANRKNVFQLNKEEYELASKAILEHKEGYIGIKESNFKWLFGFSFGLVLISSVFAFYSPEILQNIISDLVYLELSLSPRNIGILFKSGVHGLILVIYATLLLFYFRVFKRLVSKGEIKNYKEVLLLYPFVGWLYLKTLGES